MIYQLPNGRVLYLTLDEYLNLSDFELDELSRSDIGSDPYTSMNKINKLNTTEDIETSIDYDVEYEETSLAVTININQLLENSLGHFEIEIEFLDTDELTNEE
jgi:hypothetical protein